RFQIAGLDLIGQLFFLIGGQKGGFIDFAQVDFQRRLRPIFFGAVKASHKDRSASNDVSLFLCLKGLGCGQIPTPPSPEESFPSTDSGGKKPNFLSSIPLQLLQSKWSSQAI